MCEECKCDCEYECDCNEEYDCEELVCFEQNTHNSICLDDLCSVNCVKSYITDTRLVNFCRKSVLKICYAVDISYLTENCEEKQHTIYDSIIFMSIPEEFNLCKMKATSRSFACDNSCCNNISVKTIIKICG